MAPWKVSGYRAEAVPTPNVKAFQTGKEYGNNGQCNPTYFTVGNLVQYLQNLEEQGLDASRKSSTATCSSPPAPAARAASACTKPSTAWRCATPGFDGFRVLLFQQSGGLSQSDAEAGLEMNLDFFLGILNALNCGDVMNEVAYADAPLRSRLPARPTAMLDESMDYMHEVFRKKRPWKLDEGMSKYLGGFSDTAEYIGKFVKQLKGDEYVPALQQLPRPVQRGRNRPPARQADRQDHRRILGADHRGRWQLQHVQLPAEGRRAGSGGAHRHLDHVHDSPGGAEVQGLQGPRRRRRAAADVEARHARQDRIRTSARRWPS